MSAGFAILMIITTTLGIVSVVIISSLNANTEQMVNKYSAATEENKNFKFETDFMVHMMHHYIEGHTEDVDKFYEYYNITSYSLNTLKGLAPEYENRIVDVEIFLNDIFYRGTRLFSSLDSAWEESEEIQADWPGIKAQIELVINTDTHVSNMMNASLLLFNFDYQTHMMHHYLEGTTNGTRTKFVNAGYQFDTYMTFLTTQTDNLTTQNIIIGVNTWHQTDFENKLLTFETGLFDLMDLVDDQSTVIHVIFKDLRDKMDELDVLITADLAEAKNNSSILSITSLIIIIIVIVASLAIGIAVAIPTVKNITRTSKKIEESKSTLEKVINASSETSVNVANIATELAASSNEVNATSEQVSSTTLTIAQRSQSQAQYLSDINQMADNIKSITKTITNISEQTNLLALNASIEAGRVGEHGLGFAVVASKIQQLAEESKNSVEKTTEIVNSIRSYIQNAASESKEISDAMEEISSAMEEQTASTEEITATTSRLSSLAEDLKEVLSRHTNTKSQIKK
jgi:methyl-accepting chemotaxis protein